jgi:7-keto-8-aminopelargonate synthetase-like enzyme
LLDEVSLPRADLEGARLTDTSLIGANLQGANLKDAHLRGAKLSRAKLAFFDHNDPDSLDQALAEHDGARRLVVVEGVYSMDGDTADLPRLLPVAEKHGVGVLIDEAHSILVYGAHGRGVVEHYGAEKQIGLQFATFSKAFAGCGGFTVGPRKLLHYARICRVERIMRPYLEALG